MNPTASGAEEYSQLRTEMTYRFIALWTLLGTSLLAFLAGAAAVLTIAFGGDRPKYEPLLLATPLLLAIVLVCALVSWDWLRQIYRIGSYLVVFHEKPEDDVPADELLGWITRNRRPKGPIGAQALNHPLGDHGTVVVEYSVLLVAAWIPMVLVAGNGVANPLILAFSILESLLVGAVLFKVRGTFPTLTGDFTASWTRVRDAERRSRAPGALTAASTAARETAGLGE